MCSAMGRFSTGTIGFGILQVRGLNLVPAPPAIKIARIIPTLRRHLLQISVDR